MQQGVLLNSSLASALARPDAVFQAQSVQTTQPPIASPIAGGASDTGAGGRGPAITLMVLILITAAGVWWLRPHLS